MVGSHNKKSILNNLKISGYAVFVLMLFASAPALAQEKQDMPNEEHYSRSIEESQHLEGNTTHREVSRDSIIVKPAPTVTRPKAEGANGKKQQEETLSFNVLYYIIQKFKVSDIIN